MSFLYSSFHSKDFFRITKTFIFLNQYLEILGKWLQIKKCIVFNIYSRKPSFWMKIYLPLQSSTMKIRKVWINLFDLTFLFNWQVQTSVSKLCATEIMDLWLTKLMVWLTDAFFSGIAMLLHVLEFLSIWAWEKVCLALISMGFSNWDLLDWCP